jgi:hypothetical protein
MAIRDFADFAAVERRVVLAVISGSSGRVRE